MSDAFEGLIAIVQYRRKRGYDDWHNMAAFDSRDMAQKYADDCSKGEPPWEYRVVDAPNAEYS